MKQKPLLEDKLRSWRLAYEIVLEELLAHDVTVSGGRVMSYDLDIGALRCTAARTAAILIQGTDHGHD